MSELGNAMEAVRAALSPTATAPIFPDLCDILSPTLTNDGYGNSTEVDSVVAQNIPCKYETLSQPVIKPVAGGVVMTLDYLLTLPFSTDTRAIEPSKRIKVLANGANAEIVFEQPTFLKDSFSPFVEVAAKIRDV